MTRLAVVLFRQESHSFVPGTTTLADFERSGFVRGADVLRRAGNREVDGYLDAAEAAGAELVPILDSGVLSGPRVETATFETVMAEIIAGITAVADSIDGVLLGLHGAMITEAHDDGDGEIIARVRAAVGPDVPIAVTSDLHTHMTARMAEHADIIVGYQTCPHVDLRRTGRVAAELLLRTVAGEIEPVISMRKIPMMSSSETHDDRVFPNNQLIAKLHEAEQHPKILSATAYCTQPWFDVPELGWTTVVVTDGDPELGRTTADELARHAWSMREHYRVPKMDVDEAIRTALAGEGVFALSEGADSTTGGGAGDGNLLLRALLRNRVTAPAFCMVVDPAAVATGIAAGIGATITVPLGGSINTAFYSPIEVTGVVRVISDGAYHKEYGGIGPASMGPAIVLAIGSIQVLVATKPPWMVDYTAYLSVGLDPTRAKIVQPKSAGAYREYYEPIATCIDVALPGPCDSDLTSLPFVRIPRPLWPWDPDLEWDPIDTQKGNRP